LPGKTVGYSYQLEYGQDTIEIQSDAIEPGQRVVILDDLLATGGTLSAAIRLIEKVGGKVVGAGCIIELTFLNGRRLLDIPVTTLVQYDQ
jgi:adenine phosphoribosyltransferase